MSCIWSGNVENVLHAVQLRRIVDQLTYWALRVFKPWVTECLEYWYGMGTDWEFDEDTEGESEEGTQGETDKYKLICPIKSKNLTCENAEQPDQKG